MPSAPTRSLLTISAVARRFGLSRHQVRKAMAAGELETFTLAGQTYIKATSAIAFGRSVRSRGTRAVA